MYNYDLWQQELYNVYQTPCVVRQVLSHTEERTECMTAGPEGCRAAFAGKRWWWDVLPQQRTPQSQEAKLSHHLLSQGVECLQHSCWWPVVEKSRHWWSREKHSIVARVRRLSNVLYRSTQTLRHHIDLWSELFIDDYPISLWGKLCIGGCPDSLWTELFTGGSLVSFWRKLFAGGCSVNHWREFFCCRLPC